MCVMCSLCLFFGLSANSTITSGINSIVDAPLTLVSSLGVRVGQVASQLNLFTGNLTSSADRASQLIGSIGSVAPTLSQFSNSLGNASTDYTTTVVGAVNGIANNITDIKAILDGAQSYGLSVPASNTLPDPAELQSQVQAAQQTQSDMSSSISTSVSQITGQLQSVQSMAQTTLDSTVAGVVDAISGVSSTIQSLVPTLSNINGMITPYRSILNMVLAIRCVPHCSRLFVWMDCLFVWMGCLRGGGGERGDGWD